MRRNVEDWVSLRRTIQRLGQSSLQCTRSVHKCSTAISSDFQLPSPGGCYGSPPPLPKWRPASPLQSISGESAGPTLPPPSPEAKWTGIYCGGEGIFVFNNYARRVLCEVSKFGGSCETIGAASTNYHGGASAAARDHDIIRLTRALVVAPVMVYVLCRMGSWKTNRSETIAVISDRKARGQSDAAGRHALVQQALATAS